MRLKEIRQLEDNHALKKMLVNIPLANREVLMLRYVSEMPPRKIAKFLHRKPETVRKQLLRGRQMLVACYTEVVSNEQE